MTLPPLVSFEEVHTRLQLIFPEGTPNRRAVVREISTATVFTMLYIGAVEGRNTFAAPKHIFRMSDDQAALLTDAARLSYSTEIMAPGSIPLGKPWYADNSREPIRDETLRQGLIAMGAALEKHGVPTTSPKPRYALTSGFAALFSPTLTGDQLEEAISKWGKKNLSHAALTSIALTKAGASKNASDFIVEFPSGETRKLSPGPSSIISKHVIETFSSRFLENPAVLWLSESGNKVVERDDVLAKKLKLNIDAGKNLPDIIIFDATGATGLLVFVEVVATDGPITEKRRANLLKLATDAGFSEDSVAFVTAFMDRKAPALRRAFETLAWNSFVWVASEPEHLIALVTSKSEKSPLLRQLLSEMSQG